MRRLSLYAFALWLLSSVVCCGSGPPGFHASPGSSLLPSALSLSVNQTQDFEAAVFNSDSPVVFSVDGGDAFGTIDAAGLYTAPAVVPPEGKATVRAKLANNLSVQATTEVELLDAPPAPYRSSLPCR